MFPEEKQYTDQALRQASVVIAEVLPSLLYVSHTFIGGTGDMVHWSIIDHGLRRLGDEISAHDRSGIAY